jgi:aryl-alcohol dehydrogenase-like predicted oxidoreductase
MTAFYGDFDRDAQEAESLKTIATALDLGINLLDTAWIYQVRERKPSAQSSTANLTSSTLLPYPDPII